MDNNQAIIKISKNIGRDQVINGHHVLKKSQRKTILLLSDFFQDTSGVANMSKQIIFGTCHVFNWIQLACKPSVADPNSQVKDGQIVDMSQHVAKQTGVSDCTVVAIMSADYGNANKLFKTINLFQNNKDKPLKIDAIMHFTDPRFWGWLYAEERRIRTKIPLMYYNVWDNLPYPQWNQPFYMCCDFIANMSKQTHNIVKNVCKFKKQDWQLSFIPLGINSKDFFPLKPSDEKKLELQNNIFGNTKFDFIVLYNSRNITRKHAADVLLGFKCFADSLPDKNKVSLIMKTDVVDVAGTNLFQVYMDLLGYDYCVKFISDRTDRVNLNLLYNIADVTVSLSSAEGFGLSTAESVMAGTPIIATVTGGLQDQMRFENQNGQWIDFDSKFPTNAHGKYKKCGCWAYPIYSDCQSTAGSPATPYVWQSYSDYNRLAEKLLQVYNNTTRKQRKSNGIKGRQWLMTKQCGINHIELSSRMIDDINTCLQKFTKRKNYQLINMNLNENEQLKFKGIYNAIKGQWS